jgi:glycogen synthase kinase 3 beta
MEHFATKPPDERDFSGLSEVTKILKPRPGYEPVRSIASGAFGAVFEVRDRADRPLAIKKTLQEQQYKNRELQTLQQIDHPNCLRMYDSYFTREGQPENIYLHIVTDLFPTDLSKLASAGPLPPNYVMIFAFQIFRGIAYLHSKEICHRDIKPGNILIDLETGALQICDFGSAKVIIDEPNKAYIATRPYRAPELLLNQERYSFPVDVWAVGCVIAEMLTGGPLFRGKAAEDLIWAIQGIIGSPTKRDLIELGLPHLKLGDQLGSGIASLFPRDTPAKLVDLLERIFTWSPAQRIPASACLSHPYFEPIREGTVKLANGETFVLEPEIIQTE